MKTVLCVLAAWTVASFALGVAWIGLVQWATVRDTRRSDRSVAEQLTALGRNQTAEQDTNR
jgi:hypothetical protein